MNPIHRIIETTRRYFQTDFEKPRQLRILGNPMACAPVQKLRKDGLEQSLPPTASVHGVNHLLLLHNVTLTALKIP